MSCTNNGAAQYSPRPFPPKPVSGPESDPFPTTFVQADTATFKQVVQMLTGSSETAKQASTTIQDPALPLSRSVKPPPTSPGKQVFKLYERRNNLRNCVIMNTRVPGNPSQRIPGSLSPRCMAEMSPSALDFPNKLVLSPVTPLREDPFNKSSPPSGNLSEEEKAVADKGFYLHPSPRKSPRDAEPELLQLFPTTSGATSFTER